MSLTSTINIAFSGLRATQAGLDVVAQNVANSGTVGYTRRTLASEQLVAGGKTIGVDVGGASRTLDTLVQRQLRLEQAGAAYTSAKASAHTALDSLFDSVGGIGTLPSLLDGVASKLRTLAANPSSYAAQSEVLSSASDLAGALNDLSGQVQGLRKDAESALAADVSKADGLIGQIAVLNGKIAAAPGAALSDQRDALGDQLSTLIDVKATAQPNGTVTLATTGGLPLVDGTTATHLSFDAHTLGPEARYSTDPSQRTVGTITATDAHGTQRDVIASGLIRSGDIAAQIELRDTVLPQAQRQLDELAQGLSETLSDKTVAGTAASVGGASGFDLDLSALQNGNAVTVTVADGGGATRTLTFVKASSAGGVAAAAADGKTAIDFSGGPASVAAQIGAALGSGYTVSNPSGSTLRVLGNGATTSVTALAATATVTGIATGDPELPLFVDGARGNVPYTGSYESGAGSAGFAARISVNPAVVADRASLSAYGPAVPSGDSTRASLLADRLTTADRSFSGQAGIGGSSAAWSGSVSDFAQQIVATQADASSQALSLDSGQKVVLNAVESRYNESAGVNIDTELTNLIQLQTAYGANARILSAAKDLFDTLFRIAG